MMEQIRPQPVYIIIDRLVNLPVYDLLYETPFLKGGKSRYASANLTINIAVDSECIYSILEPMLSVTSYTCVNFTDIGKIRGFLLPTLVSLYGSTSVYQ